MAAADPSKPNLLIAGKTPLMWITEICVKANAEVNFEVENVNESACQLPTFRVTCKVSAIAGKEFNAVESARNIKTGKHMAAMNILIQFGLTPADLAGMSKKNFSDSLAVIKRNAEVAPLEVQEPTLEAISEESNSDEDSFPELHPPMEVQIPQEPVPIVPDASEEFAKLEKNNYTLLLNEFCAKSKTVLPIYKILKTEGPPHRPIQTVSCTVHGGKDEPYYLEGTYVGSQKVIRQILASQLLFKMEGDAVKLKAYQESESKRQAEEEKRLLDAFNLKSLEMQEAVMCKDEKCAKLADHSHHFLQKNLRGQSLALLKSAIKKNELSEKNAVDILNMIREEHIARGFQVKTRFEYYVKRNTTICLVHFHFNAKNSNQSKSYTHCGSGATKDSARGFAAKEMLEFLMEMSYHKGV